MSASRGADDREAFIKACADGNTRLVRRLLDRGADVEAAVDGQPAKYPLWIAVRNDRHDTVRLLLERGADVNRCLTYEALEWRRNPPPLHNSRPAPRHRHTVDAPGIGPMAPRGATSRAPHRVFPVAPSHAQGVVLLGPQRRLFHDGPEVDAGLHVRAAYSLGGESVVRILPATKAPRRSQRTPFQNPPPPTAPSPT